MGKAAKSKRKGENKVKMMVVPWRDKEEFRQVYAGVFSEDLEPKQRAMAKMTTWQSRALNKLPIAIESTMALCRACISHQLAMQEGTVHENHLKLVYEYSMGIIRFVNNITELGQTGRVRMAVHTIAGNFGIPNWIVEMRHSATHRTMPSLSELTAGTDWVLEWLKEDFWDAQLKIMETIKPKKSFDLEEDREFVDNIIKKYMADTLKAIRTGDKSVNCYSDLLRLLERHKSRMLCCIFKKGHFIPTNAQLRELNINKRELMRSPQLKIPDILGRLWGPLLNILHRMKLTSALVQLMVTMVTDTENFQNFFLCSWLQRIISSNSMSGNYEERNLKASKRKLYKYRRHIPHRLLLEKLLRQPSIYTQVIIKLLLPLQTPAITPATKKKIYKILDVVCGKSSQNDLLSENATPIHSIIDVDKSVIGSEGEESLAPGGDFQHQAQRFNQSPWTRDQDILNWERIPLGSLDMVQGQITPISGDESQEENPDEEDFPDKDDLYPDPYGVKFKQYMETSNEEENGLQNKSKIWTDEDINIIKQTMDLI
ncbi:uncharacterized protein LOC134275380 [Saccostrea cucullata]|uniref:uncharacterized protein LOC134275380 n=1 Tax=Saccostrea cuccullata TaxID=36930 RepID=UPI002ECFD031